MTIYSCPTCGSTDVQLQFPCWVPANAIDDRSRWELDHEAKPERDSEKGFCRPCGELVLVATREAEGC